MNASRRRRPAILLTSMLLAAAPLTIADPGPHPAAAATVHRVLFDNSKAETAGNADWIISTSMPDPLAQNPNPTSETSWTGAISAWGVGLQRTGRYSLKTLPAGNTITYGGGGALDLANFDEFVLPEPNSSLSSAEKTAIMRFVQGGGGLFLVVDHTGSDRNNDGWDSVKIANDLLTNNGVDNTDPFGFSVDVNNIGTENPTAINDGANPVLHGPFGAVTGSIIRNGSTQTLHPTDNAAVKGLVYRAGYSGNTGAEFSTSTFGAGRVAVWGDSSPIDDGTGQSGNTLYNGWNDPAGTDAALALNATEWLAGGGGGSGGGCTSAQLLGNPGFETGTAAPWSASSGVVTNDSAEPAHGGTWKAWLDGYGAAHTDTVSQTVSIPATCTSATLSFWLHVDTAETSTSTAYDTLTVTANGTRVAGYSNVDAGSGYTSRTVDLTGYVGRSVTLTFTGVEGSKLQTSFVLDDAALTVS
ncbi:hydrolase [Plantactinospora siamensis]|uniref:Hydrolase n=1 Tax=Plantactinospora siamensis TaxID=555372 RepID=A0ABV6NTQ9_9ACTN